MKYIFNNASSKIPADQQYLYIVIRIDNLCVNMQQIISFLLIQTQKMQQQLQGGAESPPPLFFPSEQGQKEKIQKISKNNHFFLCFLNKSCLKYLQKFWVCLFTLYVISVLYFFQRIFQWFFLLNQLGNKILENCKCKLNLKSELQQDFFFNSRSVFCLSYSFSQFENSRRSIKKSLCQILTQYFDQLYLIQDFLAVIFHCNN
eukprot:TRINITY_DN19591_c1_g1_i2.p1 TRINITY_DN19591_c1_g1~~TRINITY_DN19591_c1_g1_i2.p1  ORF type:complete len:203 (+),score=2.70 TRINITY_DN19591_c1_g1_i2:622-1230(+)